MPGCGGILFVYDKGGEAEGIHTQFCQNRVVFVGVNRVGGYVKAFSVKFRVKIIDSGNAIFLRYLVNITDGGF